MLTKFTKFKMAAEGTASRFRNSPTKLVLRLISRVKLVPFDFHWSWADTDALDKKSKPAGQVADPVVKVVVGAEKANANANAQVERNLSTYRYHVCVALAWLHTSFVIGQFFKNWTNYMAAGLPPTMYFHILWFLGTLWISIYHCHLLLYRHEIATMFNSMVEFNGKMEELFGRAEFQKARKKQDIITFLLVLSIIEVQTCAFGLLVTFPNLEQFTVSLIPTESRSLGILLGFGFSECTLCALYGGPVLVECYLNLYYYYTTQIALRCLLTAKLRSSDRYVLYQSLRLLTSIYNKAFGEFMIPGTKLTLGVLTVTAILGCINGLKNGTQPIFIATFLTLAAFSIFIQLFLYPKASSVHSLSVKLCRSAASINVYGFGFGFGRRHGEELAGWRRKLSYVERVVLKERMKPFGVIVGNGLYEMRHGTPATFIDIVINYSMALLIG